MRTTLFAFVATLLTGCAAGAVIDTTASVVGGVVDGVADAVEWTTDQVTE